MKVGLVGAGLIGRKRAAALWESRTSKLVIVADIDASRAERLATDFGCEATADWQRVVSHPQVEVVIVSTVNKALAPVTIAAARSGKHVLSEKPLGRNSDEARQMVETAHVNGVRLKTGFNHRYHPGIRKAHEICGSGGIGKLYLVRCVYGHGGRPGYDKEWRSNPDMAGGGELLDQGVHVVDLCRWFLGEFSEAVGFISTYFWDLGYFQSISEHRSANSHQPSAIGRQLEDNAFALLRTPRGQVASLHTSWTQWKNRFSFEVYGEDGYVIVEGLGGSYGPERLRVGRRKREGGAPDEEVEEFAGPDKSWEAEWRDFVNAIRENREPLANGVDGLEAMRLIHAIYESARTGKVVRLESG